MCARPSEEVRINRIDLEEWIFPFDQPIKRCACGLWYVNKDDRLLGCHDDEAGGAFLMLNGTLLTFRAKEINRRARVKRTTMAKDVAIEKTTRPSPLRLTSSD